MNQNRTIKIFYSNFLSEQLINKIAYAKFSKNAPAYAEQLSYMMFCDKYETNCFHVVATDNDNNVCGYLYCIQNSENKTLWYYGDLFVIAGVRRQGIATQMIKVAMQHLSEIGATVLRCYVERSNTASFNLQISLGFVQRDYEKFNDIDNEGQMMFEAEIPTCFSVKNISSAEAKYIMALYTENKKALHGKRILYKEFQECLSAYDKDELNFLIYKGAMPVAWLKLNGLFEKEIAWIGMLVVHNKFRHQGIGQLAIRYAEQYLKNHHHSVVKVHVTGDNISAQILYQKMGYVMEAEENVMFDDGEHGERLTFVKCLV